MNPFTKTKITRETSHRNAFPLSSKHITTSDFFCLQPVFFREMVGDSKISIDVNSFARLKDMPVPTFGDAHVNLRAFFVPFRTIFPAWDDFYNMAVHTTDRGVTHNVSMVSVIGNTAFTYVFLNELFSSPTQSTPDIIIHTSNGSEHVSNPRQLTWFGRHCLKILNSLGYVIDWNRNNKQFYSALPLLSFCKIYLDWYFPSQYVGSSLYNLLLSIIKYDASSGTAYELTYIQLENLLSVVGFVTYEEGYFTSAFDNPNGPFINSNSTNIRFSDPNSSDISSDVAFSDDNALAYSNVPFAVHVGDSTSDEAPLTSFSQYVIDALKRLSDFMKRNQLAGARAFDRYLAKFGLELPADKIDRSYYLGSHRLDLMVQDVMSTASTDDANLGSYAGKGLVVGDNGHFEFDTKEFGFFVILQSLIPDVAYSQGIQRHCLHLTPLDFFNGSFDALGNQAISKSEVFVPQTLVPGELDHFDNLRQGVFGFIPRYAEYKKADDLLTGDFRFPSTAVGDTSPSWHLFRLFDDNTWNSQEDMIHNDAFVFPYYYPALSPTSLISEGAQYNRIFYNTSTDATLHEDHFIFNHYFKYTIWQPMRQLFDTWDFADEGKNPDTLININGTKVS